MSSPRPQPNAAPEGGGSPGAIPAERGGSGAEDLARGQRLEDGPPLTVEPLQGWHLPLLADSAFLPLLPDLQRTLLLRLPGRLLAGLAGRGGQIPLVLVAARERPRPLGLILCRRINRSGSCWQVEHLRLSSDQRGGGARHELAEALLRSALGEVRGATSWIATACSGDNDRLAVLRRQGFQPLRHDTLWQWTVSPPAVPPAAPSDLELLPLDRRSVTLLWHLEQAVCPALLRQLLDRRSEDLLDESGQQGWLLVDKVRGEAVAGVRQLRNHPDGGPELELSVHPLWAHLVGEATELLLRRLVPSGQRLWLRSAQEDQPRGLWLAQLGARAHGDTVLMARSVWRRQDPQPSLAAARRIEAVLAQLQPRHRPIPTPLLPDRTQEQATLPPVGCPR